MVNILTNWQDILPLQQYKTLNSTSDFARSYITQHNEQYGSILALEQTCGRGRRGYPWISKPGNLYFSFFYPSQYSAEQEKWLCYIVALAICDALIQLIPTQQNIKIKWPNDILIDDAKIGGILVERFTHHTQTYIIIGIGINIIHSPKIDQPTTNLSYHGLYDLTPIQLINTIMPQYFQWQNKWHTSGNELILNSINTNLYKLHEVITAHDNGQRIQGKNCGINNAGEITIKLQNNSLHTLHTGILSY